MSFICYCSLFSSYYILCGYTQSSNMNLNTILISFTFLWYRDRNQYFIDVGDLVFCVYWCVVFPSHYLGNGIWVEEAIWYYPIHPWRDVLSSRKVLIQWLLPTSLLILLCHLVYNGSRFSIWSFDGKDVLLSSFKISFKWKIKGIYSCWVRRNWNLLLGGISL